MFIMNYEAGSILLEIILIFTTQKLIAKITNVKAFKEQQKDLISIVFRTAYYWDYV